MIMDNIIKQNFKIKFKYDIFFTENSFQINNKTLLNILSQSNNKKNKVTVFEWGNGKKVPAITQILKTIKNK